WKCLRYTTETGDKIVAQTRCQPLTVRLFPLRDPILTQFDINPLTEDFDCRKPAVLRLIRRISEQLAHCAVRHSGKRLPIRLEAVEAIEHTRFAETLDKIYLGEPGRKCRRNLGRNHPEVRYPFG